MKELTREEFAKELNVLGENRTFNVISGDTGSVHLNLNECNIAVSLNEGIDGEITIFRPQTNMEVTIDFGIVDAITKDSEDSYCLVMSNMADIEICVIW